MASHSLSDEIITKKSGKSDVVEHESHNERNLAMKLKRCVALIVAISCNAIIVSAERHNVNFDVLETTIEAVHTAMRQGELTCRQLIQSYLNRIEAYDQTGPNLNTIQTVNSEALLQAEKLDDSLRASGLLGPLHCVPILLKDQVETTEMPTTYGSVLFEEFTSTRDATIVLRMKKAGAIILAKTTMGEFASRFVGSAFGIIRNAYDPSRNPSGSSGGTGSSVAANFGLVGIGEDTSGSIRGPASVNNLVGLRPTVPLVSRFGMMPATPTTDTLGPITRTVRDSAILLEIIAGYDQNDPLTAYAIGQIPVSYTKELSKEGLLNTRIGVIREPMDSKTDRKSEDYQKVHSVIGKAFSSLQQLGAKLVDPAVIPNLTTLLGKKLSNNNFSTERAMNNYLSTLENAPMKTLEEILLSGKVTPWRASAMIKAIGKPETDSDYLRILLARQELRQNVLQLMAKHKLDALVYATFDHQPTIIENDVLTNAETRDRYGLGSNRGLSPNTGFPAITVPAGFTTDDLPVGLEFLGRPFSEALLLKLAYAFEQGTQHRKPPKTTPALNRAN